MRISGSILAIAASALVLAAGLVVRAVATSQPGPFYVYDSADPYAIRGNATGTTANTGVEGVSTHGYGVWGTSKQFTYAGVGNNTSGSGYGVIGSSPNIGVWGTGTGIGVKGITTGERTGVYGVASGSPGSQGVSGFGYVGAGGTGNSKQGGSVGVLGTITGSQGAGVYALTESTGALSMDAYSYQAGGYVMSLDENGNLILKGTLTPNGTPLQIVRGRGTAHATYGGESTTPAIQDTGEGRIAFGTGYVAIDRDFAETLDASAPYQVLLTPEGDCRGLFVTAKTLRGFAVRELMGGRSSVAFAYRIVGRPVDARGERLAHYNDALARMGGPPGKRDR